MIDPNEPIEYRYLNMDTCEFCASQSELSEQVGEGGLIRAMPSRRFAQVLYAASRNTFTEFEAIIKCRKLTGVA